MCGRYVIFSTPEAIRALFRYGEQQLSAAL
jgi:hypothetical protein